MTLQSAEEYLKEKGINPQEPIFWYSGVEYLTMEQAMTDYAKLYACEKVKEALKLAAERAEKQFNKGYLTWIATDSILSLADELINEINKEI